MTDLLKSLNWRQIVIHLTATVLLTLGIEQIAFLTDIEFIEEFKRSGTNILNGDLTNPVKRMTQFLTWVRVFEIIGLIISTFLMIRLSSKFRFFWTNTVISLLIAIGLFRFGLLDSQIVKQVFTGIGNLFSNIGLLYTYIINGLILSTLGLVIFFSAWTRKLIQKVD